MEVKKHRLVPLKDACRASLEEAGSIHKDEKAMGTKYTTSLRLSQVGWYKAAGDMRKIAAVNI